MVAVQMFALHAVDGDFDSYLGIYWSTDYCFTKSKIEIIIEMEKVDMRRE